MSRTAAQLGFEPRYRRPERRGLPLADRAMTYLFYHFCRFL